MEGVRMTLAEYTRWREALPRGPFGRICPPVVVLIVTAPAVEIAPRILADARADAARARS